MDWYEKLEQLREMLGDDTLITEVGNFFSADQMRDFVDSVICDHDLEDEFNEDDESDEDDD